MASGHAGYSGFGASLGKPVPGVVQPMGQALPQLSVRATGPGADIRWEDFNYPPGLRLIHFDITELPLRLRKTVRLLNFSFLLTTFACLLNAADTAIFVSAGVARFQWLIQSVLHVMLLPPAALGTFYLGYRGVAAPEPLLVHRFQFAQLGLAFLSVMLATFPYKCINGLLSLAYLNTPGMEVFRVIVILVESSMWMMIALLSLLNVAQVRRINVLPNNRDAVYGSPPAAKLVQ